MKRLFGLTAALAVGMGLAQASWAIAISEGPHSGTDVGDVDSLMTTAELDNSGKAENAWLQGLFPDAEILAQEQSISYYDTNTLNIYAFALNPLADYFMIRTPSGSRCTRTTHRTPGACSTHHCYRRR